ncbi:MAG: hypothetical protein FJW23_14615 [Acidimicrobiia bacterium]|nr:hypothetical protein [Acidimicrobiia bacterium]
MSNLHRPMTVAGAVVLLNLGLTFTNVWPTLWVWPTADVSAELALLGLCLVAFGASGGRVPDAARRWLAIGWVVLVVGHYADVTTQSLYGREVNLYWDLRLMPSVGAMFAAVATTPLVAAVVAGVVIVPLLLLVPARLAVGALADAVERAVPRRVLGTAAVLVLAAGGVQIAGVELPFVPRVSAPALPVYARQVVTIAMEATGAGRRPLPAAPDMAADLAHVQGADVLVVFVESYGAVSWSRPDLSQPLARARARFSDAARDTGRQVVSAYAESTTFGGESWLAHISFLSGTPVRDQDTNIRLMAEAGRDTLAKAFTRRGYRAVALMPGLQRAWPEGRFYGFDRIYGTEALGYDGPPFGWWGLTDQYALARLDALESQEDPGVPRFVFFPTISGHAPFTPAPPYQPDWVRVLTREPYDAEALDQAWSDQPDWTNLSPSYVKAIAYGYDTLGGYLRQHADRDLVMLIVGDHQPPSLVSGESASWDVPVHVVASRAEVLEGFRRAGFRDGLEPELPVVAGMDGMLTVVLEAFSEAVGAGVPAD